MTDETAVDKVPDYMEPLQGVRLWFATPELELHSLVFTQTVWQPDTPVVAGCAEAYVSAHGYHIAPTPSRVGIHAYKDFDAVFSDQEFYSLPVWATQHLPLTDSQWCIVGGLVDLWGTVEVHTRGYRATYAYPRTFFAVPEWFGHYALSPDRVPELAAQYHVPLADEVIHEHWRTRAHRYRRTLEERYHYYTSGSLVTFAPPAPLGPSGGLAAQLVNSVFGTRKKT